MNFRKALLGLVLFLISYPESLRACDNPVYGDYNGDGATDAVVASVGPSFTTFTTLFSPDYLAEGAESTLFGRAFTAIVNADYDGDCRFDYGGVRELSNETLEWRYKTFGSYVATVIAFGEKGDLPFAANVESADDDPTGAADLIVMRPCDDDATKACFSIRLSSSEETVGPIQFGLMKSSFFVADVTGDNQAELIEAKVVGDDIVWTYREFDSETETTVTFGKRGARPLAPADLNQDGIPELLTARIENQHYKIRAHSADDTIRGYTGGPAVSVPLTGKFGGLNKIGWYRRNTGRFYFRRGSGYATLPQMTSEENIFVVRAGDRAVKR